MVRPSLGGRSGIMAAILDQKEGAGKWSLSPILHRCARFLPFGFSSLERASTLVIVLVIRLSFLTFSKLRQFFASELGEGKKSHGTNLQPSLAPKGRSLSPILHLLRELEARLAFKLRA